MSDILVNKNELALRWVILRLRSKFRPSLKRLPTCKIVDVVGE
jgi:hypothetical protein